MPRSCIAACTDISDRIAAYSEDIVNGLLAIARCACCYHNGGAGPSEYLGDSFSDSLTGPGDNGYFPREIP